jgi:hypothetical protein
MNLANQIERLRALHAEGALTDTEFAQAKAALLARLSDNSPANNSDALRRQDAYLHTQNELNLLDQEWARKRERYMEQDRHGVRSVPSQGMSVIAGVASIGFGILWMISTTGTPAFAPLFGLLFIIVGAATSIHSFNKASNYKYAEQQYIRRRAALLARHRERAAQHSD